MGGGWRESRRNERNGEGGGERIEDKGVAHASATGLGCAQEWNYIHTLDSTIQLK